jgi:hypothetical protein
LHEDLEHFRAASQELGFTAAVSKGAAGLVCARLLIQTARPLGGLIDQDIADSMRRCASASSERAAGSATTGARCSRPARCSTTWASCRGRHRIARGEAQSFEQRLARRGVSAHLRPTMVA